MTPAEIKALVERTHDLKLSEVYFDAVLSGEKPFEVRRDDRGFQRGDVLCLREVRASNRFYTGRKTHQRITYILTGGQWGIEPGYVVLGLSPLPTPPAVEGEAGA